MDYPKSIPSVGLVNGKFVDENPVAGTPGSLIPSAWGNSVTQEMLNVITAGGLVPAEADLSQLVTAIRSIVQASATNYAADTGTAGVYVAAFTPALTALTDGTVVRVKIKTANTGASTFNPNGLGAKPIVGAAHAALQGGELVANGHAWLQYNSSLSGGSWVILASSGGAQQVVRGVSSGQAVNQSQLGSLSGVKRILNASTTLAAADVGALISVEGAAGSTQTLMPIVGVPTGGTIVFTASTSFTIVPSGSETISVPEAGNVSAIQLAQGDTITLTRDATRWWASSYSKKADLTLSMFTGANQSLVNPGFQKTPGGDIRQWGTVSLSAVGAFNPQVVGGVTWYSHFYTVTLPRAYLSQHFETVVSLAGRPSSAQGPEPLVFIKSNKLTAGPLESLTSFSVSITTPMTGWVPVIHYQSTGK